MTVLVVSPLVAALLRRFYDLYGNDGFPHPSAISILARENTGGGRYVTLSSSSPVFLPDGHIDLGGKFMDKEGHPNGMKAVIAIRNGRAAEMEIAVYGGDHWDGEERAWVLK